MELFSILPLRKADADRPRVMFDDCPTTVVFFESMRREVTLELGRGHKLMGDLADVFDILRQSGGLPILFVGSGITKRYTTNNYTWEELLLRCIEAYDSDSVRKYKTYELQAQTKVADPENREEILTHIASSIEYDFNMAVYDGKINMNVSIDSASPLKEFISNLLSQYRLKEDFVSEIDIMKRLRDKMLTVVTTNYDTFLEDHIFTSHNRVIGAPIILGSEIGTLIKMHGCVTSPKSIVITKNDYVKMERKSKVLAGKLIHLFTENPVIFLGYSLTDLSIQRLLFDIFSCVESTTDLTRLKERLIYVEYDKDEPNVNIGDLIKNFEGHNIYMTKIRLSNYRILLEEMCRIEKITKLKEVFFLKDLVKKLVVDYKTNRTKLVNLSNSDGYSGEEIVVAIGKEEDILHAKGLSGLEGNDIYEDIIFGKLPPVESQELMLTTITNLCKRNGGILPVHKYLRHFTGELNSYLLNIVSKEPEDILNNTIKKDLKSYNEFIKKHPSANFEEILKADLPAVKKLHFLVLKALSSNPDDLRAFLVKFTNQIKNISSTGSTIWRKLVLILDIKENKC